MNLKASLVLIMVSAVSILCAQENQESTNAYKSLYKTKIDLTVGADDWANNIASVIFDESIPENQKTTEFNISKQKNNLLVNNEIPLRSNKDDKDEDSKSCETVKKTCRSEKCVASTLIEILGDGDRDVLIKYERKMLSVQIYYTYQDCQ